MRASVAVTLGLACAPAPPAALAQGPGRILGVVRDSLTREPVEGALLVLAGTPRAQRTDSAGRFVFLGVPAGSFRLVVRRVGYQPRTVSGTVSGAAPLHLSIELTSAGPLVVDQIQVAARAFQREDEPASVQTVDRLELSLAPVTTLAEVLELAPGVSEGHVRGGRVGQATTVIDGLDVRDQFRLGAYGGTLELSPTAVQELSVVTGGFGAQYGNAVSGVVDIATRSGSPTHWEARAALAGGQLLPDEVGYGFTRYELGAGGPLRFLGSGSTLYLDAAASAAEDADPRRDGLTCLLPGRDNGCQFRRPIIPHHRGDQLALFARFDRPLSGTAAVSLTALWGREQEELYASRFKYNLSGYLAERRTSAHLALSAQRQVGGGSRAVLITARVGLTRLASYLGVPEPGERPTAVGIPIGRLSFRGEDFIALPVDSQLRSASPVPGYQPPTDEPTTLYGLAGRGLFFTGGTSGIVQTHRTDQLTADLSSTTQVGPQHVLQVGATMKWLHVVSYERAVAFSAGSSPSYASFFPRVGAVHLTSTLQPTGGATLKLGVRLEAFNPRIRFTQSRAIFGAPSEASTWQVQVLPRVGFVTPLALAGLPRTVARWNYSASSQPPAFQFFFDSGVDDSLNTTLRRQGNPTLGFERASQYELGVTHLITPQLLVEAVAYYKELTGLVTSGVPVGREGSLFTNLDQGRVKGGEASIVAETCCGRLRLAYTWQDAAGSVSTPFDSTGATPGTRAEDVPLAFDRRHSFDLLGTWQSSSGKWSLAATGTAASGTPIPGRADGKRLPWSVQLNARIARRISVRGARGELFADGRNLLKWRTLLTARPETGSEAVDLAALEERARLDTQNAFPIPRESPLYSALFDANRDGIWSTEEQLLARRAALLDAADPSLFFGPPRRLRIGVALSWGQP